MAVKTVQVSIKNIDDAEGLESTLTALKNIDGVLAVDLEPDSNVGLVRYEDTQTSYYAFRAAISMVDYVTQPYPKEAPQNPDN